MKLSDIATVTLNAGTLAFFDETSQTFLGFFDIEIDRFYKPNEFLEMEGLQDFEHWEILDHFTPRVVGQNKEQTVYLFY